MLAETAQKSIAKKAQFNQKAKTGNEHQNSLNLKIELRLFYFPKTNSPLKVKYANEVSIFYL